MWADDSSRVRDLLCAAQQLEQSRCGCCHHGFVIAVELVSPHPKSVLSSLALVVFRLELQQRFSMSHDVTLDG